MLRHTGATVQRHQYGVPLTALAEAMPGRRLLVPLLESDFVLVGPSGGHYGLHLARLASLASPRMNQAFGGSVVGVADRSG
jgi:hypothetical protein